MALFARVGARAHFMRGGSARDEWDQEPWVMLDWGDDDDAAAAADDVAAAAAAAELSSRMISFGEEGEGEASLFACICPASAAAVSAIAAAAASSGSNVDKMMQPSQLEIRFTHHTSYVVSIYTKVMYIRHISRIKYHLSEMKPACAPVDTSKCECTHVTVKSGLFNRHIDLRLGIAWGIVFEYPVETHSSA